jgi:hypothetical protein
MIARRRRAIALGIGCLCTTGLGFLSGMVTERIRFDVRRNAVVSDLGKMERRLHGHLMDLERGLGRAPEAAR